MSKAKRGFKKLIGKTIKSIDSRAVNIVVLKFTDGSKATLDCNERSQYDISLLNVEYVKPKGKFFEVMGEDEIPHCFNIGEIVKLVSLEDDGDHLYSNKHGKTQFMGRYDLKPTKKGWK